MAKTAAQQKKRAARYSGIRYGRLFSGGALSADRLSAIKIDPSRRKVLIHDAGGSPQYDRRRFIFLRKWAIPSRAAHLAPAFCCRRTHNGHSSPAGGVSMGPSGLDRRTTAIRSSVRSHGIIVGSQPDLPRRHRCRPAARSLQRVRAGSLRGQVGRMPLARGWQINASG